MAVPFMSTSAVERASAHRFRLVAEKPAGMTIFRVLGFRVRTVVANSRAHFLRTAACRMLPLQANFGGADCLERRQASHHIDVSLFHGGVMATADFGGHGRGTSHVMANSLPHRLPCRDVQKQTPKTVRAYP